jgi:serine/threonine protein kinase
VSDAASGSTGGASASAPHRALPIDRALRHAIDIADALHKAHRRGIVHRDLKPGNVMLTSCSTSAWPSCAIMPRRCPARR